jgi:hypothetical protein
MLRKQPYTELLSDFITAFLHYFAPKSHHHPQHFQTKCPPLASGSDLNTFSALSPNRT